MQGLRGCDEEEPRRSTLTEIEPRKLALHLSQIYRASFVKVTSSVKCALLGYSGADNSLARPTSRFILFDGENISFDASLVICKYSTNIPQIMIINRIYETQNLLSL